MMQATVKGEHWGTHKAQYGEAKKQIRTLGIIRKYKKKQQIRIKMQVSTNKTFNATSIRMELAVTTGCTTSPVECSLVSQQAQPGLSHRDGKSFRRFVDFKPGTCFLLKERGGITSGTHKVCYGKLPYRQILELNGPWLPLNHSVDQHMVDKFEPRSKSKAHLEIDPSSPFLMCWLLGYRFFRGFNSTGVTIYNGYTNQQPQLQVAPGIGVPVVLIHVLLQTHTNPFAAEPFSDFVLHVSKVC